jgi:hypothetical protein
MRTINPVARTLVHHALVLATLGAVILVPSQARSQAKNPLGGCGRPVEPGKESPVLLLGDSHTLVFHIGEELHATGAGLADQLAGELGMGIDVVGVRGSGATPARISLYREGRSNPGYLQKKKLILWCFTAREFTEGSGWRKLPVAPR